MTPNEVYALMSNSRTEAEWNANADKVKAAHGGDYPQWWYVRIILGGAYAQATANFVNPDPRTIETR